MFIGLILCVAVAYVHEYGTAENGQKQPFGSVPLSGHSYPFFDPENYPQVSDILELLYGQAELQATEVIEQRA